VTLRFRDAELERAFQIEAGARFRRQVVFTILSGAATWAATGLLLPLVYPVDQGSLLMAIVGIEVVILTVLAMLPRARTWDQMQVISGAVNMIGGFAIIWIGGFIVQLPHLVTPAILVNMLFAFGLSRLGVLVGAAVSVPYVALFAVLALTGRWPGVGLFEVFLAFVALEVAISADYLLESSTRNLFWAAAPHRRAA
jgi:hypothetical protein